MPKLTIKDLVNEQIKIQARLDELEWESVEQCFNDIAELDERIDALYYTNHDTITRIEKLEKEQEKFQVRTDNYPFEDNSVETKPKFKEGDKVVYDWLVFTVDCVYNNSYRIIDWSWDSIWVNEVSLEPYTEPEGEKENPCWHSYCNKEWVCYWEFSETKIIDWKEYKRIIPLEDRGEFIQNTIKQFKSASEEPRLKKKCPTCLQEI